MKQKKNSRNTKNPYELISGVELVYKGNKHIKVSITATSFSSLNGKNRLVMDKFNVNSVMRSNKGSDFKVVELFKKIGKFATYCKNPLEVITLFIDAYKANTELLTIKFKTCPAYPDAIDNKFVYDVLIRNR